MNGVPWAWLVDPIKRTLEVYVLRAAARPTTGAAPPNAFLCYPTSRSPTRPPEPLESSMFTGAASHPADTARLTFRSWRAEDEALALGLWGDPRVTALIDARGKLDADEVRQRLKVELQRELEHGIQYWPIFLRDTGEHGGCCGLRPYDPARSILELGFHMRGDHWGKGLATEAARSVIGHAFTRLGASALFAGHHPGNVASRRTLEKLGFRYTQDELYAPTGLYHPSYLLTRP